MLQDLLWALRWLRKNPLFTTAATAILALGIGANTAVFSIVDAVLLRPLPYASARRLVRIDETSTKHLISGIPVEDYLRWQDRPNLFEKKVPYLKDSVTLTGGIEPDQVFALRTSGGLFPLLGVRAALGRALVDADDDPASPKVAVLSDRLWRRLYYANPAAIGRTLTISGEVFTIAGVMPPEFEFQYSNIELWVPLRLTPALTNWLQIVARLKPSVTPAQAQSALQIVAAQLEHEDPVERAGLRFTVSRWSETPDRKYELTLVFILAAVALVLLIACADVGGLLLSRAVGRQREIAIRASLGAGLWRLARQMVAESLLLAVLGSVAGIAGARYLLPFLTRQLATVPNILPHLQRAAIDQRVLVFNVALCLMLALLCSLAPVLSAARTDLQAGLRGNQAAPRSSSRLFSILIASQAAFAFLLLVGSGLMIRSLARLQQEDHGFRPDHVLTMRVPIGTLTQTRPSGKYDTRPRQMAYYREIVARLAKIPTIKSVAVVNNLPLSGVSASTAFKGPDGKTVLMSTRTVSPQYFAAMGVPIIAGRTFTDGDQTGSPPVAIINEYLARQLFPKRSPLGEHLPQSEPNAPTPTVVGVAKDSAQLNYDQPAKGEIYIPYRQFIFAAFMSTIVARTSGDPLSVAAAVRKEVRAVDPDQPIVRVETMNDVIADATWRQRFSVWVFSAFGSLALLLTSAGVYSVVAYTSALRVREVGIRVALGATPQRVVAVILRGAMAPLAVGLAVSLVAALLLSRLLASLLYEIDADDPITYLGASALLLIVGTVASAWPAWRAATADPVKALRSE
ncbi:MAG: ABC transporter permease [Bryobacteraceae bacterium]|jgi:putative ABC transport system permease protein